MQKKALDGVIEPEQLQPPPGQATRVDGRAVEIGDTPLQIIGARIERELILPAPNA